MGRKVHPPTRIVNNLYVGGEEFDSRAGWVLFDVRSFEEGRYIQPLRLERVVKDVIKAWKAGRPVLVHCKWGRGRSVLVVAAVFVREYGIAPIVAERLVRGERKIAELNRDQRVSLNDYYDWLVERRILNDTRR